MSPEQYRIFLYRYLNRRSTEEENRLFDDFFESYQQKDPVEVSAEARQEIRERIWARINKQPAEKRATVFRLPVIMKIAAAVLLLISFGLAFYPQRQAAADITVMAQKGERKEVLLSDGTVVTLNAGSRLIYPEVFKGKERTVQLEGEAFFDVARDEHKPFSVFTESLHTTVLGTSFNVSAYKGEENTVTVMTGKVQITSAINRDNSVMLTPDQQAYLLQDGTLSVKVVNGVDYLAWNDGIIYLKDATLTAVAGRLERKYGIHVQMSAASKNSPCKFNGSLADDQLTNVLENLRFISGLDYKIVNDTTIWIHSVSCD